MCVCVCVCVCVCKHFQRDYLCPAKGILVLKALWGCIRLFNRLLILAVCGVRLLWSVCVCVRFCAGPCVCVCACAEESGSGSEGKACTAYQNLINNLQWEPGQTHTHTRAHTHLKKDRRGWRTTGWQLSLSLSLTHTRTHTWAKICTQLIQTWTMDKQDAWRPSSDPEFDLKRPGNEICSRCADPLFGVNRC